MIARNQSQVLVGKDNVNASRQAKVRKIRCGAGVPVTKLGVCGHGDRHGESRDKPTKLEAEPKATLPPLGNQIPAQTKLKGEEDEKDIVEQLRILTSLFGKEVGFHQGDVQ